MLTIPVVSGALSGARNACRRVLLQAPPVPLASAVPLAACVVHRLRELPSEPVIGLLVMLAIALLYTAGRYLPGRERHRFGALWCAILLLAVAYCSLRASAALDARLPTALEGVDLLASGYVANLPMPSTYGITFEFVVTACSRQGAEGSVAEPWCSSPRRIRLGWAGRHEPVTLRPGSQWSLPIRLKRVHGLVNPGGFDSELRAIEEGVTARGYVREKTARSKKARETEARETEAVERRAEHAHELPFVVRDLHRRHHSLPVWIHQARQSVVLRMNAALASAPEVVRGTLVALVTGEQSAIPANAWQDFNRTSTSHLMSISGLHVTFFAALSMWLIRRALRIPGVIPIRWLLFVPAPALCVGLGALAAIAYTLFSGSGIPAQRTSAMLAVGALALYSGRNTALAPIMALVAAIVTLLDPWAPMASGFWLSFVAVAAIVSAGSGWRFAHDAFWLSAVRTQWAATVALIPLGAVWFGSISLVGPLANAIAIPLVSMVITPLALLAAVLQLLAGAAGDWLLQCIALPCAWLLRLLTLLSSWPAAIHVTGQPPWFTLLPALLGAWWLLVPWRPVNRAWAAGLLVPLFVIPVDEVPSGAWRVMAFDVGQGSAILVQTENHALLFDSGPVHEEDSGAGNRVVMPVLHGLGISRLDTLVLSHADSDHVGGAATIMTAFDVRQLLTSIPAEHPLSLRFDAQRQRCGRGMGWTWDGVHFELLHPGPTMLFAHGDRRSSNANSCVLRVTGPGGSVLLAGDIEKRQEREQVAVLGNAGLQADVLLAPHHGSATSSTPEWLDQVAPRWVVFQVGYRNRFGHPAARVLKRYMERDNVLFASDRDGAVEFRFAAGAEPQVVAHRHRHVPYWRTAVAAPGD